MHQRDINKAFKLRGLGLGRDSLAALEGHLKEHASANKELSRIVDHVIASGERERLLHTCHKPSISSRDRIV